MLPYKDNMYTLLETALSGEYTTENISTVFSPLLFDGIHLIKAPKKHQYINCGFSLHYIHVLLSGKCYVVNYTIEGKSIIADTMEPVQMLGLYEAINDIPIYIGTIITIEDCYLLKIPVDLYKYYLDNDIRIAKLTIKYLAKLIKRIMNINNKLLSVSPPDRLALYIYRNCIGNPLPYTLNTDRKTMSQELHINLRTLYRYINNLKQKGYIDIIRGKITVNEKNFKKLSELANSLLQG